jgi:hypothetical protein
MDKQLIVLPFRKTGSHPEPKRPLMFFIGGKRYEIRIDAKITPIEDKPADIIPIDRGKQKER